MPPIRCKNAESALIHGKEITDTIADWVKNKYIAGPFNHDAVYKAGYNAKVLTK